MYDSELGSRGTRKHKAISLYRNYIASHNNKATTPSQSYVPYYLICILNLIYRFYLFLSTHPVYAEQSIYQAMYKYDMIGSMCLLSTSIFKTLFI